MLIACIPAYNESRTIAKVIMDVSNYVDQIIVVDDGSKDDTSLKARENGALVIRHHRNMGKGIALKTAFRAALKSNADIVITLDADGQHNPDDIPRIIAPIREGRADVVIGSRYVEGANSNAPPHRKVGLSIINYLSRKASNTIINDTQSGFRAYNSASLRIVADIYSKGYEVELDQLQALSENNLSILEVPIHIEYNLPNTSKRNFLLHGGILMKKSLGIIVERRPLTLMALPGVIVSLVGLAMFLYLLYLFNMERYFSLPIALGTVVTLIIGIMMIITGLILYAIRRSLDETKRYFNDRVG